MRPARSIGRAGCSLSQSSFSRSTDDLHHRQVPGPARARRHLAGDHAGSSPRPPAPRTGCLWFDWSRSLDDPHEYVLVEAFRDGEAGAAHVGSDHFKAAQAHLPPYLAATPRVVSQQVDQDDWSELGEMKVDPLIPPAESA